MLKFLQLRSVYKDVPQAFQTWRKAGLRIAVYSSGSVAAQKLIFGYSIEGDLRPHLSAYFDTHVGHKQQTESYTNIAQSLEADPQHVLFLTDVPGGKLLALISSNLCCFIVSIYRGRCCTRCWHAHRYTPASRQRFTKRRTESSQRPGRWFYCVKLP